MMVNLVSNLLRKFAVNQSFCLVLNAAQNLVITLIWKKLGNFLLLKNSRIMYNQSAAGLRNISICQ